MISNGNWSLPWVVNFDYTNASLFSKRFEETIFSTNCSKAWRVNWFLELISLLLWTSLNYFVVSPFSITLIKSSYNTLYYTTSNLGCLSFNFCTTAWASFSMLMINLSNSCGNLTKSWYISAWIPNNQV